VQSVLARQTIAPYSASKGGIAQLTRGMAADLARHGIQVNTLSPGYFATDMNRELVDDATFTSWLEAHARGTLGATSPSSTGAALSLLGRVVVRVGAESRRRRG
jgi:NAD(P)-dependent dehydrogenase (short-subunit alcohol dehydrogenase family)